MATLPRFSRAHGHTLYFQRGNGNLSDYDIWTATRSSRFGLFGNAVNLGASVNSSSFDLGPTISLDGLSLFFNSRRPGGLGEGDLYVVTRATTSDAFGAPVNLVPG